MSELPNTSWTGLRACPPPCPAETDADYENLFHEYRDGLQAFLYRRLRSVEDAEDAVTMTFAKAWQARDRFRGDASPKTWLYRIAARVALDMLRRRRCRPVEQPLEGDPVLASMLADENTPDPAVALLSDARREELQAAVAAALARLRPDQRRLVDLFYFHGYRYEQISRELGIPYTQVRGRLHRLRQVLGRDLAQRQRWSYA